ncbi:MAG TPA: MarR family transcriptional regulator [Acidimicrobiales bacterium]|nr:MarR family transcriptional regulator [Acidimicrobiales bacterium]
MRPEDAARQITQAVAELFFSAENQAKFVDTAAELGLTPPMMKGLLELEPGEALPMRHLADRWGCDASFVTVVVDGLEGRGFVERRVAPHDRRIKAVELTPDGVVARQRAIDAVYGPRAGFDALSHDEQDTLARLLTKMRTAQADFDAELLARPDVRASVRRANAQRTREYRGRPEGAPGGLQNGGWREHLEVHREELRHLREELARMRDDLKAQMRGPVDDLKAAKDDVKGDLKAAKADVKGELKAAKAGMRGELKDAKDEAVAQLKGRRHHR